MNIELNTINRKLTTDAEDFIMQTDSDYQKRLHEIADDIAKHREQRPIILLSGPSGSGKTTTLYSVLRRINSIESKLLTAEEPVEYDSYLFPVSAGSGSVDNGSLERPG